MIRAFHLESTAEVRLHDTTVFVDVCDGRLLSVLKELQWGNHETTVIRKCLSRGDTFIDVGANHGSYALLAAGVVGPNGRVIAFEPQPRLARMLRRSFQANHFSNAEVREIACSDRAGIAKFYIPDAFSGTGGVYQGFSASSDHRAIDVHLVRLDDAVDWVELPGHVFLKVDVEGSELACLDGAENMIRHHCPTILIELNPASAAAAGHSVQDIVRRLHRYGYRWFSEVQDYPHSMSLDEIDCSRERNIVAVPSRFAR